MNLKLVTILASVCLVAASCAKVPEPRIIPCPESIEVQNGKFKVAGKKTEVNADAKGKCIEFVLNKELAPEEYYLDVTPQGVKIQASSVDGFRFATQSIGQMLPAAYFGKTAASGANSTGILLRTRVGESKSRSILSLQK